MYKQPSYYLHITSNKILVITFAIIIIIICNFNYIYYYFILVRSVAQSV